MNVTLLKNGIRPGIQAPQQDEPSVTTLKLAVDRARRYETATLYGRTVSFLNFQPIPNRSATHVATVARFLHNAIAKHLKTPAGTRDRSTCTRPHVSN